MRFLKILEDALKRQNDPDDVCVETNDYGEDIYHQDNDTEDEIDFYDGRDPFE